MPARPATRGDEFGEHLHRVAQQAMRHSRMELTNQYYTDPILVDVT